jgi:hypothetical protein
MTDSSIAIVHTIREFGTCLCWLVILGESYLRFSGHLPFDRTFPDSYPEFLTKDHLADGYLRWTRKYGIVSGNLASTARYTNSQ